MDYQQKNQRRSEFEEAKHQLEFRLMFSPNPEVLDISQIGVDRKSDVAKGEGNSGREE